MHRSADFDQPPAAIRALRRGVRAAILWLLWLAPPGLAGLALRGGMGWELVSVLGLVVALATTLGSLPGVSARRGRLVLALGLAGAVGLGLGAGQASLPLWAAAALPFIGLVVVAGLCDPRALMVALAVLVLTCLLPLGAGRHAALPLMQAAGLVVAAVLLLGAQRAVRQAARAGGRVAVLPPSTLRPAITGRVFAPPSPTTMPPGLMVQAEKTADGTLRIALAGRAGPRLRVTVS